MTDDGYTDPLDMCAGCEDVCAGCANEQDNWTCIACGAPYTGPAIYTATCERCGTHEFRFKR